MKSRDMKGISNQKLFDVQEDDSGSPSQGWIKDFVARINM